MMKRLNLLGAVLLSVCSFVGTNFSVARAEPNGNDYYWNVPVGSTFEVTNKLNIRPSDTRVYMSYLGLHSAAEASDKGYSRTQMCYVEVRQAALYDRVINPGTELLISSIIQNEWDQNGEMIFGFEIDSPNIKAIKCNINGIRGPEAHRMKIVFFTYALAAAMKLKLRPPTATK